MNSPGRLMVPALLLAIVGMACSKNSEYSMLDEMPKVAKAMVAPRQGRLYPSIEGPVDGVVIPEERFALNESLVEIRHSVAPGVLVEATIAAGDRVDVLSRASTEGGLCLIRTPARTYCWISRSSLLFTPDP